MNIRHILRLPTTQQESSLGEGRGCWLTLASTMETEAQTKEVNTQLSHISEEGRGQTQESRWGAFLGSLVQKVPGEA